MSKMNKIDEVILRLYRADKAIVNDAHRLTEQVWYEFGWNDSRSLWDNLSRVPLQESIARRRRELHEKGLIQYSEEADKKREQQFVEIRNEKSNYSAVSWLND